MTTTSPSVAELAAAVAELDQLDAVDRVAAARVLSRSVSRHLLHVADAAVYEATRSDTQRNVAHRLGVSVKAVEASVARHLRRET